MYEQKSKNVLCDANINAFPTIILELALRRRKKMIHTNTQGNSHEQFSIRKAFLFEFKFFF